MKKGFFNIIPDGDSCTILLFGHIGEYEENNSTNIVSQLLEAGKMYKHIKIRINSLGGEVFTGMAIFNAIRNSQAQIEIYVDGVAASMGAVLALSGPHIEMSKFSRLMLHSASGGCWGNRKELQEFVEQLEALDTTICEMLASKCGKTVEEMRAAYFDGEDHWLTAQEALDFGFIDAIYDAEPVTVLDNSTPEDVFNLFFNRYENSLKRNDMYDKLKSRPRFAACANEADVFKVIDALETEAAKATGLAEANDTLKGENEQLRAAAQAERDAADEKLLTDAQQSGKIGALEAPVYRAALKNADDREQAIKTLQELPAKKRVTATIENGGGKSEPTAWENRMKEVRENLKKR